MDGWVLKVSLTQQALQRKGIELTTPQTQEVIAVCQGFESWTQMMATLRAPRSPLVTSAEADMLQCLLVPILTEPSS